MKVRQGLLVGFDPNGGGKALLRLYSSAPGLYVPVVSELHNNPGMSVTNAAHGVLDALTDLLGTPVTSFIEHYPLTSRSAPGHYSLTQIDPTGRVTWSPLDLGHIENLLIGELLDLHWPEDFMVGEHQPVEPLLRRDPYTA